MAYYSSCTLPGNYLPALGKGDSAYETTINTDGILTVNSGGIAFTTTVNSRGVVNVNSGGKVQHTILNKGGSLNVKSGGSAIYTTVTSSAIFNVSSGAVLIGTLLDNSTRLTASEGVSWERTSLGYYAYLLVNPGAEVDGITASNGSCFIHVSSGASAKNALLSANAHLYISEGGFFSNAVVGTRGLLTVKSGGCVQDVVESGGYVSAAEGSIINFVSNVFSGASIGTTPATVHSGTTACQISVGVAQKYSTSVGYFAGRFEVFSGGSVSDVVMRKGELIVSGGILSGVVFDAFVSSGWRCATSMYAGDGFVATDIRISDGGRCYASDGVLIDTTVCSGGAVFIGSGGVANSISVNSSGKMHVSDGGKVTGPLTIAAGAVVSAYAGSILDFDVSTVAAGEAARVNDLSLVQGTPDFTLTVSETQADGSYALADGAAAFDKNITVVNDTGEVLGTLRVGDSLVSGNTGYVLSQDGGSLALSVSGVAPAAAAGSIVDNGTLLANGDRVARWTADTAYTGNVYLADGMSTGNVWLYIDGFANDSANIYGTAADQNFTGFVNIDAAAGTVKNLAAGAALGGSVAGVKLTVGDGMNITSAVYAGGMGDVTGATETRIDGGSFSGNVFAGALCNYIANHTATATGDITLTVNGGTFDNNLYAGAAVKADAAATTVHTVGDITVELNDGAASKQAFCVYGGGYAAGTTGGASVYTTGGVDISISGGSWGSYQSGRGIFGGVYADKIAASVESVNISVSGGTMGNVYGGGWAQNGGRSTVGDVTITVAGNAAVNNIYGGGSYSGVSGGATSVGDVTILVSGGDIANNIFAGGQSEFSTVTGDVNVIFTGSNDYGCSVYGYGVHASATDPKDKCLTFDNYMGRISGSIGGFDNITFIGDTAAALTGAAIDNGDWTFDYTDRTAGAETAMLTLNAGSLDGNVAVDLSSAEQVAGGWSIAAGLADATAVFSIDLSTGSMTDLNLNDTLDSSFGIYAGWGFALEESTLKFKQLA